MSTETPSAAPVADPTAPAPTETTVASSSASAVLQFAERNALAGLLIVVVAFFSLWSRTGAIYVQPDNFRNIVGSQVVLAVIALGAIVPLICGQFDLSVGSVATLTSVVTATAYADWHLPLLVGAALGVLTGAIIGLLNGVLVTTFGVNAFITTLGSASVITGAITWFTGGNSIMAGIPEPLTKFGGGTWLGLPRTLYLLVLVSVFIWYLLQHTPFGRYLHSVGINPEAAQLVGLRLPSLVRRSFVISGAAAGLAGVILLAQSGAGNPGLTGNGFTLTALTAAFLGATAVTPGRFNVVGTLLAIYFLATAITGLTYAGVQSFINDLFTGAALVLAVAISTILRHRRNAT